MTDTDATEMTEEHDDVESLYVYGVVEAEASLPDELVGVQEGEVEVVGNGPLVALVTGLGVEDDIGTPDNLLAHSTVLDAVAGTTAVLPMAFGTVVPSQAELDETVLNPDQEGHLAMLARLAGLVQFTVSARYNRDEVLADLVADDPGVARLRELISGTSEDETRQARIQLGELIVKAFDRIRPHHAEQIINAVQPMAQDLAERELGRVEDVVELAVLVPRDGVPGFEDALEDVAADLHSRIDFRLLGPQAPYDFVGQE